MHGRFIVVEGLEGAGKTSAIEVIQQYLSSHFLLPKVLITREPGGTALGEIVRGVIKQTTQPLDSRSELLLLYAARVQLVEQVIRPALARGEWVIADRFELSTYAYQGGGRGLSEAWLDQLSLFCLNNFQPDLILFLDISPEQGLMRVNQRGARDRMEEESLLFFHKVFDAYHRKIQTLSNVRCIDAAMPLEAVHAAIRQQLSEYCEDF